MRRKPDAISRLRQRGQPGHGGLDQFPADGAAFDVEQFEKRNDAQGRGRPDFGQQLRHGLDVGDGGGAGAEEHLRAAQPGECEIRVAPAGFERDDGLDPVGETFGGRELPGHVGVVEMAMGVDQAGEDDHVTEIGNLPR